MAGHSGGPQLPGSWGTRDQAGSEAGQVTSSPGCRSEPEDVGNLFSVGAFIILTPSGKFYELSLPGLCFEWGIKKVLTEGSGGPLGHWSSSPDSGGGRSVPTGRGSILGASRVARGSFEGDWFPSATLAHASTMITWITGRI